jgi:hypothetical protein
MCWNRLFREDTSFKMFIAAPYSPFNANENVRYQILLQMWNNILSYFKWGTEIIPHGGSVDG